MAGCGGEGLEGPGGGGAGPAGGAGTPCPAPRGLQRAPRTRGGREGGGTPGEHHRSPGRGSAEPPAPTPPGRLAARPALQAAPAPRAERLCPGARAPLARSRREGCAPGLGREIAAAVLSLRGFPGCGARPKRTVYLAQKIPPNLFGSIGLIGKTPRFNAVPGVNPGVPYMPADTRSPSPSFLISLCAPPLTPVTFSGRSEVNLTRA